MITFFKEFLKNRKRFVAKYKQFKIYCLEKGEYEVKEKKELAGTVFVGNGWRFKCAHGKVYSKEDINALLEISYFDYCERSK